MGHLLALTPFWSFQKGKSSSGKKETQLQNNIIYMAKLWLDLHMSFLEISKLCEIVILDIIWKDALEISKLRQDILAYTAHNASMAIILQSMSDNGQGPLLSHVAILFLGN